MCTKKVNRVNVGFLLTLIFRSVSEWQAVGRYRSQHKTTGFLFMSSIGTRQVHLLILWDDIRTVHCSERFLHWSLNTSILATFVCKFSRLHVRSFSALMILVFFTQQKDIFKVLVGLKAIQEVTLFSLAWRLWKVILMTKAEVHLLL